MCSLHKISFNLKQKFYFIIIFKIFNNESYLGQVKRTLRYYLSVETRYKPGKYI